MTPCFTHDNDRGNRGISAKRKPPLHGRASYSAAIVGISARRNELSKAIGSPSSAPNAADCWNDGRIQRMATEERRLLEFISLSLYNVL